jgi:hypothetical protein
MNDELRNVREHAFVPVTEAPLLGKCLYMPVGGLPTAGGGSDPFPRPTPSTIARWGSGTTMNLDRAVVRPEGPPGGEAQAELVPSHEKARLRGKALADKIRKNREEP